MSAAYSIQTGRSVDRKATEAVITGIFMNISDDIEAEIKSWRTFLITQQAEEVNGKANQVC